MLIRESLIGVISLPSGVFQPYTGVKTSILVLDKQFAKKTKHIMFSNVQAIGISLGIKRTPTEHNDLPHILQDYTAFYAGRELSTHSWLAERNAVLVNGCNLTGERYRPTCLPGVTKSAKLGVVCAITKGTSSSTKTEPGPYPLIVTAENWLTSADYQFETDAVCVPLISSTGHGRASIKRIHYATGKFAVANLLAAVQPLEETELVTKFLYLMLDTDKDNIASLMNGAANVSMKVEDLAEFEIPLPPLEVQKEIVSEIEGYQKVLDGARAVLDNYRFRIPIHPDWPKRELGKLAENLDSRRVPITKGDRKEGPFPYYGASGIVDHVADYIFDEDILLISEDGANLLARSTPIAFSVSGKCWVNNHAHVLKFENPTTQKFVEVYLNSISIEEFVTGAAQPKLNQQALNSIPIPIPIPDDLATQQAIVAEIEAEQALVAANRDLVARFQKKIQATLARIWEEEE